MNDIQNKIPTSSVDELYAEAGHWHINTGEETIHAKRVKGKWRTLKWWANSFWLIFFLGPYLRWDDRQAVLFDIPNRQFHIFGATLLPQDFFLLALLLLFFAILLAVVTAVAGRVWCGFFCFQTIWTDVFTWIEEKFEGAPQKRRKLENAPWNFAKIKTKVYKHSLWLIISVLTGISFTAWFVDAIDLWAGIVSFELGIVPLAFISMFILGTYILAGFMREQACFWLCPYARIQGVMIDNNTVLPTYDFIRGEPRGRVKKGQKEEDRTTGDCIDCNQCVAVCPTGVDIRNGQQEGCITCALCIDACDAVMEKVGRPKGLIRYESLDDLEGGESTPIYKRGRVWVYCGILTFALSGILYGLATLDSIQLKVLHDRQPLFVMQSDGSIQNKYRLKMLNKLKEPVSVTIEAIGPKNLVTVGIDKPVQLKPGTVTPKDVFVRVPRSDLKAESENIKFIIKGESSQGQLLRSDRTSVFIGPK
ncbi:MAG: cytochrome c oxidase accessory protein CcoG [Motiliproteus sp.]|nr:cytochrome c oxidase accessory protein CcoG [Motiliproteus sp.]MCW9054186.1 cytochrome c oxidase accessory protein CcoG [Motiliproteus sp.]